MTFTYRSWFVWRSSNWFFDKVGNHWPKSSNENREKTKGKRIHRWWMFVLNIENALNEYRMNIHWWSRDFHRIYFVEIIINTLLHKPFSHHVSIDVSKIEPQKPTRFDFLLTIIFILIIPMAEYISNWHLASYKYASISLSIDEFNKNWDKLKPKIFIEQRKKDCFTHSMHRL